MSDKAAAHRDAVRRHELVAENHDRAASFWDGQGDLGRAELQREMAAYERLGAELESRWAELVDPGPTDSGTRAAQLVVRQTRQGVKQLCGILTQLAITLERSAELAEAHGRRRAQAGRGNDAAAERRAAKLALETAQWARPQAGKDREPEAVTADARSTEHLRFEAPLRRTPNARAP